MGCGGSKLEEASEAVILCKGRCQRLSEAVRLRYALANAHADYLDALEALAGSFHRFFLPTGAAPPSPALILPHPRKGDPLPPLTPSPPPAPAVHSRSSSGHIASMSDTDDEEEDDDDDDMPLHSDDSPIHLHGGDGHEEMPHFTTTTTTKTNFHFAKKGQPATSVTYEQRPYGAELGHVQFGSSQPYYHPDPYVSQGQTPYGGVEVPYPYAYPYPAYPGFGGGFFGSAAQQIPQPVQQIRPSVQQEASSRPPPAPPSPPKTSTWDFFNLFESYDNYYPNYTPSRSSRELREEEGIPELEDEDLAVVKEAYGDLNSKAAAGVEAGAASSSAAGGEEKHSVGRDLHMEEMSRRIGEEQHYKMGPGIVGQNAEYDVHVVSRSLPVDEISKGKPQEGPQRKVNPGTRSVPDVVNEVVIQFHIAKKFGQEVSKMLEVGKFQYHQKKYQVVPSRIRYITPSISTSSSSAPTSKSSDFSDVTSSAYGEMDEEKAMQSGNLSATLQKLYIWEKKLLDEVKGEEDMRLTHERKSRRLRRLDDRGAEHQKIDSARHEVKKLSTRIKIAIEIIHSISTRISKLRDTELWPQVRELINGLLKMWQVLMECHRTQRQAILEANALDAIAHAVHREATVQLILELLRWSESFSNWVDVQKSFVKELNEWLKGYIIDQPEETADGVVPFSPGRLGAPPVFVICNNWAQAMETISEADVVEAMSAFTTNILSVWQHYYANGRQHMVTPDMNRDLKTLERENQSITKAVEAVNRKRTQVGNNGGYSHTRAVILMNHDTKSSSMHSNVRQLFEAMERFAENFLRLYEGLDSRCREEDTKARGGAKS